MTAAIIITFCILLLLAYVFDLSFAKTRIPSVILLLLLGWVMRQTSIFFNISVPNLSAFLPVFGTIGLILIVLEGALELELNRSKIGLIKRSFVGALVPIAFLSLIMAISFYYIGGYGWRNSIINAIPLCVISSAIAIPSVRNLSPGSKEFVVYESSLSDIIGVLFFNFMVLNASFGVGSLSVFLLQLLVMIVVSFLATAGLSLLLSRIDHHIKFIPIILLIILIYEISKVFNLPSLIFILIFGLAIGNLDELKGFKWIRKLEPDKLNEEVEKFKGLTIEAAFLIRAIFFIVFGYFLETADIMNTDTLVWAIGITLLIFLIRALQLKLSKLPLKELLFVAPRGLITILLFLSIPAAYQIELVNRSLVTQVILLTALTMMIGLMLNKRPETDNMRAES